MRKDMSEVLESELVRSGFVEEGCAPVSKSAIDLVDLDFESRLINWGRITNPDAKYTGAGGADTFWARKYIENRNNRERQLAIACGVIERENVLQQIENQVFSEAAHEDALAIERVWSCMVDYQQKTSLKMRYVDRVPDAIIRRKLHLRGMKNLNLILWRAKSNLKHVLESGKKPVIIQSQFQEIDHNLIRRKRA
ncbi:hypothetical protein ACO0K2_04290 [Undibacterium sp. MH2W]|uniref:hypothetical protein n=1 Tax=Undibacterium sp. MH2W TaxID=3413044 RepID=UPI003BF287F8